MKFTYLALLVASVIAGCGGGGGGGGNEAGSSSTSSGTSTSGSSTTSSGTTTSGGSTTSSGTTTSGGSSTEVVESLNPVTKCSTSAANTISNLISTRFCQSGGSWFPSGSVNGVTVTKTGEFSVSSGGSTATYWSYSLVGAQFFTDTFALTASNQTSGRARIGDISGVGFEEGYDASTACPSSVTACVGLISLKEVSSSNSLTSGKLLATFSSVDWGIWEHAFPGVAAGSNGGWFNVLTAPTLLPGAGTYNGYTAAPVVKNVSVSSLNAGILGMSGQVTLTWTGTALSGKFHTLIQRGVVSGVESSNAESIELRLTSDSVDSNGLISGVVTQTDLSGNTTSLSGTPVTGRFIAKFGGATGQEIAGRFSIYLADNRMVSGAFGAKL